MAKTRKASDRARTSRNSRRQPDKISPSRARMLGGGGDEDVDDDQDAAPARRVKVPEGWRTPAAGGRANRDAARQFANRGGANAVTRRAPERPAAGDPGDENDAAARDAAGFVDDMLTAGASPGVAAGHDANDEAQALQEIQDFVLELAAKYANAGDERARALLADAQFHRAFPNARIVDATTVDVGNGTLVDIVDRTVPPTPAARAALRDRLDATLAGAGAAAIQRQVEQLIAGVQSGTSSESAGLVGSGFVQPAAETAINDELRAKVAAMAAQGGRAAAIPVVGGMSGGAHTPGDFWTLPPEMARTIGGGLGAIAAGLSRGEPIRLPAADGLLRADAGWPAARLVAPAMQAPPQLDLSDVTHQDLDQMWDWARQDPQGARDFMGTLPAHSRALYDWLYGMLTLQREQRARINSIILNRRLIGFVALAPIDRTSPEPKASVHLYLEPSVRGILPQLLPALLQVAEVAEPGVTLMIETRRPEWARILERVGFTSSMVLTRRSRADSANQQRG